MQIRNCPVHVNIDAKIFACAPKCRVRIGFLVAARSYVLARCERMQRCEDGEEHC